MSRRRPRSAPARLLLAVLLPPLVAACADAADPEPYDLLVTDARLVDVVAGETLGPHTVAVRDGRVADVWPADEAPEVLTAGRIVDGAGRYLLPGLWDAHVHFRGGEELREENRALLALYPRNGVTTVRDAGGDLTEALLAWRDSIAAGELLGPRILTSGPKLDGPDPAWDGSLALADPSEAPAALDSLEAMGADYVKLYDGTMSPEVFLAAVREAEARGTTITGHMPLAVDFLEAVEAGLDGTEHLYYVYKGTAPNRDEITRRVRAGELGFWDAFWTTLDLPVDSARRAQVFQAMAERGTAVVPTLHIGGVLADVENADHADDPELADIPQAIQETYRGRVESARRSSRESRDANRALRERMAAMVEPMHEAGVRILAGSDAGPFNSYTYPGTALHGELEALVQAGLTPAEALRTATTEPAAFMGLDGELGRVAPGYRADLVLVEGDPLEDIGATREVAVVVQDGRVVVGG